MTKHRNTLVVATLACLGVAACGARTGSLDALETGGVDARDASAGIGDARTSAGDASDSPHDAPIVSDSEVSCVGIDVSAFDRSCETDSDCIAVFAGVLCAGYNCICPAGGAINAADDARYRALVSSVPPGPGPYCQCPYLGDARCLQRQCAFCVSPPDPNSPPGCVDGG